MPCIDAIVENAVIIAPATRVEKAMALLKQARSDFGVVLDDDNKPLGIFSIRILLEDLLPVAVPGTGGVVVEAAPGVAKRLQKTKNLEVKELMSPKYISVGADARLVEGIKAVTEHKTPALLIADSGEFMGVVTEQSLLNYLEKHIYDSGL